MTRGQSLYRLRPETQELAVDTRGEVLTSLDLQGDTAYLSGSRSVRRYDASTEQLSTFLGPQHELPDVSPAVVLRSQDETFWIGVGDGLLHLTAPQARHVRRIEGALSETSAALWSGDRTCG